MLTKANFDQFVALLVNDPDLTDITRGNAFERAAIAALAACPELSGGPISAIDKPRRDMGTDAVLKMSDGRRVFAQVKFTINPEKPLGKKGLDTFFQDAELGGSDGKILVTNRHVPLGRNARPLEGRMRVIGSNELRTCRFDWLGWWADKNAPSAVLAPAPQPHQKTALAAIAQGWADGHARGQVIMAVGTGKTFTAAWAAQNSASVMVVVPTITLLEQTVNEWRKIHPQAQFTALMSGDDITDEDFITQITACRATTDPAELAELWSAASTGTQRILVSTYASAHQAVTAGLRFDLLIADEAHKVAGPRDKRAAVVLDAINAGRRLFFTATPRIVIGGNGTENTQFSSMDREADFGPVFHRLTFGQGVEMDLLAPYKLYFIGVREARAAAALAAGGTTTVGQRGISTQTMCLALATVDLIRKHKINAVMSFHGRVKESNEFATAMRFLGVGCDVVTGASDRTHRDGALARLRNTAEPYVLANPQLFSEGIDVPHMELVVLSGPNTSATFIGQAIGRCMRRDPHNPDKIAHILVPTALSDDASAATIDRIKSTDVFRNVLQAMMAHDDSFRDEIAAVRRELAAGGAGRARVGSGRLEIELEGATELDVGELQNAIFARVVEQATRGDWEVRLSDLVEWVRVHGRRPMDKAEDLVERSLGGWVRKQKRFNKDASQRERVCAVHTEIAVYFASKNGNEGKTRQRQPRTIEQRLAENNAFFAANGRAPSQAKDGEKPLFSAMHRVRSDHKAGKIADKDLHPLALAHFSKTPTQIRAERRSDPEAQAKSAATKAERERKDITHKVLCITTGQTFPTLKAAKRAGAFGGNTFATGAMVKQLELEGTYKECPDKTTGHIWRLWRAGDPE